MLENIANNILSDIKKSFQSKGHHLTGKFEKSLRYEIIDFVIKVYAEDYGIYLDRGIKASDVPFSRTGGGGKSKYIQGLMNYGKLRLGLSGKAQKSFAFATAYKHKKTGIRIKEHGQGTHFITNILENIKKESKLLFNKEFKIYLETKIKSYINEFNNN